MSMTRRRSGERFKREAAAEVPKQNFRPRQMSASRAKTSTKPARSAMPKLRSRRSFDRSCRSRDRVCVFYFAAELDLRFLAASSASLFFSSLAVAIAAACANKRRSISDEPTGRVAELAVGFVAGITPDNAGSFGWARHNSLMRWIPARVVYSLPAIFSVTRRPRSRSLRSPGAPMLPSGNAILAAMSRRSGTRSRFSGSRARTLAITSVGVLGMLQACRLLQVSQGPRLTLPFQRIPWSEGRAQACRVSCRVE